MLTSTYEDKKASSYRGVYRVPLLSLSVCPSVCVTLVVFTDCDSCTRPISTKFNPGSMEPGEHGPTRGTCSITCRLEVVAVAGLMWVSWCVLGGAGFFRDFFFSPFFFLRTHTAYCKYEATSCLVYISTSDARQIISRSIPRVVVSFTGGRYEVLCIICIIQI